MVVYFAYGSNMAEDVITERAPSAVKLGRARLPDYRLRFSRRSIKSDSGVADIVKGDGFSVLGVLYEVPLAEWEGIRRKEGVRLKNPAYQEIDIEVYQYDGAVHKKAVTFTVINPEREEQVPSAAYIAGMREQASNLGFHHYVTFLRWLERLAQMGNSPPLRTGLLTLGTTKRTASKGRYIVRAHPRDVRTETVLIKFDGRLASAVLESTADISPGFCEIDQNLRHALGMTGKNSYGYTVELIPARHRRLTIPAMRTRQLHMQVGQTNWSDSEKRICVLHPRNLALLGIKEGEHVRIEVAAPDGKRRNITLRCFTSEMRPEQQREYPDFHHIYLDGECREELMVKDGRKQDNWPATVRPSVRHLVFRRCAVYGVTFLLGTASLSQLLILLLPSISSPIRGAIAVAAATVSTVVVAYFDVRSVLRY